jgi:hypothetical protein
MRYKFYTYLFLSAAIFISPAQAEPPIPELSNLTEADIRSGVIAFVNMATSPGLEGVVINVDNENRQSEQIRSSLGFSAEFTLKDHNGYWVLPRLAVIWTTC